MSGYVSRKTLDLDDLEEVLRGMPGVHRSKSAEDYVNLVRQLRTVDARIQQAALERAAVICEEQATRQQKEARIFQTRKDSERESKANVRASQSLYMAKLIRDFARDIK